MFISGSTISQRRAPPLPREPEPALVSTPEDNNKDAPDTEGNTQIRDLVNVTIARLVKVNTPPKFRGE